MEPKVREVMPPHPGASFTIEQAMAAWKKVAEMEREKRLQRNAARRAAYHAKKAAAGREGDGLERGKAPGRKGGRMEPQIRKVMPPHPGASITVEQAKAAFIAAEEEQRQARLQKNAARRAAYRARKVPAAREP